MTELKNPGALNGPECDSEEDPRKMEELLNLIREDCQLSTAISPDKAAPSKMYSDIQTVLLIGVTGMLGPYFLQDLSQRPQIKRIYCLIRKTGELLAFQRLQERLEVTGLTEKIILPKVICLNGDICDERLGFSNEEYNTLSENIDAVVHLGINADYTGKYSRQSEREGLRAVNVIGTVNMLKFAANEKLKCVYFASNLLCAVTGMQITRFSEDWQDKDALENVAYNFGYGISRFISEQLLKQALDRGIPVKVFRFGLVGGDSQTGRSHPQNHFFLGWLTFLKLVCIPSLPIKIPMFPIDFYSKLSMNIFFNDDAPSDVYNVCNKDGIGYKNLIDISKELGFNIKPVSLRKFMVKVKKTKNEPLPLAHLQRFYLNEKEMNFQNFMSKRVFKGLLNFFKDISFENSKTARYIPNINDLNLTETWMRKDIRFLIESGAFVKYAIKK